MPSYTGDPFDAKKHTLPAGKFMIRWKDVFRFESLLRSMKDWFLENGWGDSVEHDPERMEIMYTQRESGFGQEIWFRWRPQKIPGANSYFKYHLDVDCHLLGLNKAEVLYEGKKLSANKGEIELTVTATLEFDYDQKWSKHPLLKFTSKWFPHQIMRKELYEQHRTDLYRESYRFQNFVKQFLQLPLPSQYAEEGELFTGPAGAFPSYAQPR